MVAAALDLKYLFGVRFTDGREYWQTPEDRSAVDPQRPASYDISQRNEQGEFVCGPDGRILLREDIEMLCLEGQGARYLVDLRDGSFRVQTEKSKDIGTFFVKIPPPGLKLLPLRFLRRRHHTRATVVSNGDGTARFERFADAGQECEYHFGWCYIEGNRVETCELILG